MVGAEYAEGRDPPLQVGDVVVVEVQRRLPADDDVGADDAPHVGDGQRHVVEPVVHALAVMGLALLQHAEEAGDALVVLRQVFGRAVGGHAAAPAAVARFAAWDERHVFDGAIEQVRAAVQAAVHDERAAGSAVQVQAYGVADGGVVQRFGHGDGCGLAY